MIYVAKMFGGTRELYTLDVVITELTCHNCAKGLLWLCSNGKYFCKVCGVTI